jgi:hypothetical protein
MTFGAPVPALKFEIWKLVGWKCSLPLSQVRAVSCVDGVFRQLRIRDVALDAVHGQPSRERSAPADLDGVAQLLLAGGFADDAPVDLLAALAQRFHHFLGAVDRRAFLVAGDQVGDRALVPGVFAHEVFGRGDHGRERALHVGGATSKKEPVAYRRFERIALPFLERAGGHDVGMAREAQHRAALAAGRPEVVDVAITEVFDLETGLGQTPRHDFLAALVGRGDGVARDEIEREIEGLRHRSALYGTGLRPARSFVTVR